MPRRLPVGIQEFETIRCNDYLYVDKTDIVYQLVTDTRYSFMSRPRRFGKTLLISTLEAYFQGRKELFEGLKIMDLETEWKVYPVLRFKMPSGGYESLCNYLSETLEKYEARYHSTPTTTGLDTRFGVLLQTIKETINTQAVVLIDEYDAPLQNTLYKPDEHERCRDLYRAFFNNLKSEESSIRFIFITGISKFTQLSLFSTLNNLRNLTFNPIYETLCGITEQEVHDSFVEEVAAMSSAKGWSVEKTFAELKRHYDGYHFSERMTDVYNPFSLLNALVEQRLGNYWIESGSMKSLMEYFDQYVTDMPALEGVKISQNRLQGSDMTLSMPEIFLYQAGYLTIKDCDEDDFELGIPNREVSIAIYENLLPRVVGKAERVVEDCIRRMKRALRDGDVAVALNNLQQLVAETPYTKQNIQRSLEEYFHFILRQTFFLCGYDVRSEVQMSHGVIDLVVRTPRQILLFEIKLTANGGIAAARKQIEERGYAAAFAAEALPVVSIAIEFDTEKKQMIGFEVIEA